MTVDHLYAYIWGEPMAESVRSRMENLDIALKIEPENQQKTIAQLSHENLERVRKILDTLDARDLANLQHFMSEANLRAYATFRIHAIHEDAKATRHTGYEFEELLKLLKFAFEIVGHDAWKMVEPRKGRKVATPAISTQAELPDDSPKPPPLPPLGWAVKLKPEDFVIKG